MSECELLAGCIFFNDKMADQPATADLLKVRYCKGDNSKCARYMVYKAKGRDNVPPDLFPGQLTRANSIIQKS